MKTPKQKRILFIAAALAIVTLITGSAVYTAIFSPKPFDNESMRIDTAEEQHHFADIVDKAQALFSGMYWIRKIDNPFKHAHEISVIDFFTDIRKDGSGYIINEIIMAVQFQQNGLLYTQHFNIRQNSVSSDISSQSLDGLLAFNDGPSIDTLTDKLDRLDYSYLSSQLPECDGHIIDMLIPSDVLYRSTSGVTRYLANAGGNYEMSAKDTDLAIGEKVPVIMMGAATVIGDTYGGDAAVEIYLNN